MITLSQVRDRPPIVPVCWSNGVGVDSTAVACLFVEWDIKATFTLFADTGGERPETYQFIPVLNEFLAQHGHDPIEVVRRKTNVPTLEEACLARDTLPDLAFGRKGCSMGWKVEPMDKWLAEKHAIINCVFDGHKVIRVIGYDYGERDGQRFAHSANKYAKNPSPTEEFWYPLREAKLDREACKAVIKNAGLPVPCKSCCFFCPAMKWTEVRQQQLDHPELNARAFIIEVNAAQGKHGLGSTKGLGRNWSWLDRLCETHPSLSKKYAGWLNCLKSHQGRRLRGK
jgi:hypothetical protein